MQAQVQEGFSDVETEPCQVCHLRNDHTRDVATVVPGLTGICAKYTANSCCSADTAASIDNEDGLYSPEYRWNKCYHNFADFNATLASNATAKAAYDECNRWFQLEECFYECDVGAGKWRKNNDTECKDGDGSINAWQIYNLPLKASECDAFYEACKDVHMCACSGPDCPDDASPKSLFGLAVDEDTYCKGDKKFCSKTVGEVRSFSYHVECENPWTVLMHCSV
jgi:hypothetical protein